MSFLGELKKRKRELKETETVVTNSDGQRFIEKINDVNSSRTACAPNAYGFVVDTKPDDVPVLISDHLYIGSQDCAVDGVIGDYKIKHVLSVGVDTVVGVSHKYVQCLDLPETVIRPVLVDCLPFINDAVRAKENVLVHCNAGVSRTAMVAIGYMICYRDMCYVDAYDMVKSKRPAIQPNAGFVRQLKLLQRDDFNI